MAIFGFEFKRKKQDKIDDKKKSFVPPSEDDGSSYVQAGGYFGQYLDIEGTGNSTDEAELIIKYRDIAQHPECDSAIEDIVNEAIVSGFRNFSIGD